MAGGDHHTYKADPSIERWQQMHNTMYERFRFTPTKVRAILLWGLAVPSLAYYLAIKTDNKWEFRGRLRGESILRKPPQDAEPKEE
ncbi:hypothetical protein BDZ90DRAFT_229465 [Jaminaea rosea]|uniref:Uncharacterized protein n=1 Tax=Jaminaea rosea TaxID=1569628 RepID=A0A316UZ04_9BASI|nr:hypothetical protein BDZ90DRAFT_229465 [Jaminaea rosea]PWN30442.1 hypothetical protein BDZ90DRAFT_229465 [Jaminaea rosea]